MLYDCLEMNVTFLVAMLMNFKLKLVTKVKMVEILKLESKANFILWKFMNERNMKELKTVYII